jgi:hypothetical protein
MMMTICAFLWRLNLVERLIKSTAYLELIAHPTKTMNNARINRGNNQHRKYILIHLFARSGAQLENWKEKYKQSKVDEFHQKPPNVQFIEKFLTCQTNEAS